MRADEDMYDTYASDWALTHDTSIEEARNDPEFNDLWEHRHDSVEAMAAMLAEAEGIEYEDALIWLGYEED